jgi:hypothetical protein
VEAALDDIFLYDVGEDTSGSISVEEIQPAMHFTLFPNPAAADQVYLHVENHDGSAVRVMLYSESGQLVHESKHTALMHQELEIPVKDLPAGIYMVYAMSEQNLFVTKLVLQR